MKLTNRTILITGGSAGIGLAFALKFLELGNRVIVTGRREAVLDDDRGPDASVQGLREDHHSALVRGSAEADGRRALPSHARRVDCSRVDGHRRFQAQVVNPTVPEIIFVNKSL